MDDRRIITYGTNPQADVRATRLRTTAEGERFDIEIIGRGKEPMLVIDDVLLSMHGQHNMRNALATVAVAHELSIAPETIRKALGQFEGVKRRFTKTGVANGITIIDDYGHHPVEIAATLKAARDAQSHQGGKVIAVVQPHRYSRLSDLFNEFCTCFNDADAVVVADIYAAGEASIEGISGDSLVHGLRAAGHRNVTKLAGPEALAKTISSLAQSGDMVVCLGAGSITKWAYSLPGELEKDSGFGIQHSGKK